MIKLEIYVVYSIVIVLYRKDNILMNFFLILEL